MTTPNQPSLFDVGAVPTGDPLARVPSELAKRDAALAAHEDNYREVLEILRRQMKWIYASRRERMGDAAFVTADDARWMLKEHPLLTGRTFASMNWLGQLFRGGEWEQTGQRIKSTTPGSHGNDLPCWRLKHEGGGR